MTIPSTAISAPNPVHPAWLSPVTPAKTELKNATTGTTMAVTPLYPMEPVNVPRAVKTPRSWDEDDSAGIIPQYEMSRSE